MPRWIREDPNQEYLNDILTAADVWRKRCFITDGSVFGDEALWTLQNVQELSEACSAVEPMASRNFQG